jgi:hypothetical protein
VAQPEHNENTKQSQTPKLWVNRQQYVLRKESGMLSAGNGALMYYIHVSPLKQAKGGGLEWSGKQAVFPSRGVETDWCFTPLRISVSAVQAAVFFLSRNSFGTELNMPHTKIET